MSTAPNPGSVPARPTPSPAAPSAAADLRAASPATRNEEADAIARSVEDRLSALVAQRSAQWHHLGQAGREIVDLMAAACSGGKRARAVLCALGAAVRTDGHARTDVLTRPDVTSLGAALELYQASALVHDDVIDHASTRRGQPATHVRLAAIHREAAWLGRGEDWGASGAILLGDLLLSGAGEELTHALDLAALPGATSRRVRSLFDQMATEVAVGQYLDVRSELQPLPGPDEDPRAAATAMRQAALEVVRRKSARYSVMYPLLLGATLAGVEADSHTFRALARFGEQVGTAFQLRDDLLGVLGSPERTGKPVGDDLREGKRTVLLALSWQSTDDAGRATLRDLLTCPAPSPAQVADAVAVVAGSGAPGRLETEIDTHLRTALETLETLEDDVPTGSRLALARTARALARRSA